MPGCQWEFQPATGADGRHRVWFLDPGTRSWARFDYQPGAHRWPVHQYGPRRLWDEIEAAYHWWDQAGQPSPDRWHFTLTPHDQRIELNAAPAKRNEPSGENALLQK
ncbi:MAG TPA: hypothetical protein VFQ77_18885 [Pseudonocardiaceae bacterium]|nr:hypothetical protein [Pseudonocardiaceae bacterium]